MKEAVAREAASRLRRGYTLVELLVSVSIIAVLLSLLFPVLGGTLERARGFRCQSTMRSVVLDFALYADPTLHGDRGRDNAMPPNRFTIDSFIDSQFGANEFWRHGETGSSPSDWPRLNRKNGLDPMRCSEVHGDIVLRPKSPCVDQALTTPATVSYGFNMRLHRAEIVRPSGRVSSARVTLTSDILQQTRVPILWDVDGEKAAALRRNAVLSAPSLDSRGPYANDRYWHPGLRHAGAMNVGFIDGSVQTTSDPLDEPWDWGYQNTH